ncbi:zinc finger protein 425-like [Cimex lectularius]|uniref:C2H2-type domain-containing protein n=1 Tax=Cimex lectularius TaxID=79782 RepID=A0A8I6SEX0_CIMLE|nr:zinc finger protein 425-like [Cimex lectularius]
MHFLLKPPWKKIQETLFSGLKRYKCPDCDRKCFYCNHCGRGYGYKRSLNRHLTYECGKTAKFSCPYCPHKSKLKDNLKSSRRRSIPHNFRCESCGRSYVHKGHLTRHQKYECGKEPQFGCPVCPYRAKHRDNLKAHFATKHLPSLNQ